jgi:spoIIIJ-associated protein
MSNQNESLNVSAKSVDEAIEEGLAQLGVTRDRVDIEIVNEGKRGIFGLGAEDAVVKLSLKNDGPSAEDISLDEPDPDKEVYPLSAEADTTKPRQSPDAEQVQSEADASSEDEDLGPAHSDALEMTETVTRAKEHLEKLLEYMGVEAEVIPTTAPDLTENDDDDTPTVLDINGKDLGVLIGRRSETLQALQYMVRLMVSKETGSWERVVVDVESYRSRRRKSLQRMANRMAERATSNNERVVLEAMSAYERRIIHLTLRDHPTVYTRSIGQDSNRKVTIIPK